MKFLHFADAHFGNEGNASKLNEFSSLRITKEINGLNVRAHDIRESFKEVIDTAIEKKVDFVIDSGDLFDQWGYKENSTYNFVLEQILRLNEVGIKYVGIIGNHDLPKIANKGTYSQSLNTLPNVFIAYKGFYEKIEFENEKVSFHCVPSTFRQDILDESLAEISPVDGHINIGIGHFGVTTIKHYAESAVNSLVVDLDRLIQANMHYFALGDYHKATSFGDNIYYPGSLVNLSFGELGNKPQVNYVEISPDTFNVTVEPIFLHSREMLQLPTLDAKGMTIEEVNNALCEVLSNANIDGKIVRLRVKQISKAIKRLVDTSMVSDLTENTTYFKLEFTEVVDTISEASTGGEAFKGVLEDWSGFVNSIENDGSFDKEEILKEGYAILSEVME